MSDPLPAPEPSAIPAPPANVHGVWFWRMAIFEGTSSVYIAMGGAIIAASATWDESTIEKMATWQWLVFWLGISLTGVKTLQAFLSKTMEMLSNKAKAEDDAAQ